MFFQFTSEDAKTNHCHIFFDKDLAISFNTLNQTK